MTSSRSNTHRAVNAPSASLENTLILQIGLGLSNSGELFNILVGYLQLEDFFNRHDVLHQVERIRVEIFDQGGVRHDLASINAELFDHNLLESLIDPISAPCPPARPFRRARCRWLGLSWSLTS